MGSEPIRVALFGLGGVGRALLELIDERDLPVAIVGAADSSGGVGRDVAPRELLKMKSSGPLPADVDPTQLIDECEPDVVIDVMSCDFDTGEPSLGIMLQALGKGISVATANKAPLARYWTKLWETATGTRASIGYAGASGAALPAAAVARTLARVDRIDSFEGILTGTTTFVLDEMARGSSFVDALSGAQRAGIAEPDPIIDVGGWDTAAKTVIIANTLWEAAVSLDDVAVTGVDENLRLDDPQRKVRIVGEGVRRANGVHLRVGPREIEMGHALGGLQGRDKGIVFYGRSIGQVVVSGGRSHPRGAAASVIGDVLDLGGRSRV